MATERLQKVLARAGVASRRAAEELISAGRVRVDGKVVTELGTKVDPRDSQVEVDGRRVLAESLVYVVLHKPRNVVSTMSDPEGRPAVGQQLENVAGRAYPVGRLDFATSGVLLATNDGDFAAALLHPRQAVPKTYVVKVQGLMKDEDLERWRRGVRLEDGPTLPAKVKFLRHEEGKTWFELTITEGRNQQIRRMGDATRFRVMRLARLAFAEITSEDLPPGAWRYLTREELTVLKKAYGVPRRIVSPPAEAPRVSDPPRRVAAPRGVTARPTRAGATAPRRPDRPRPAADAEVTHERYGGGASARSGPGAREWGGGVGRGSSGARDGQTPPRPEADGRGGRTRTTGSAGGVGARPGGEETYRVKGRRGW